MGLEALDRFCRAATARMGFRAEDAAALSDVLLAGSLRSLPGQGQGVQRLRSYHERVKAGVIDPRAVVEEVRHGPAVALLDAHRAAGAVAGTRAMRRAVELARSRGIGAVGVRDSTHFGVAAYYAELALPHDLIGFSFTNAGPEVAPWGAASGVVGTNPWAVAIPTNKPWPVVLDMANSTAGKGMIRWYQKAGREIPGDWGFTATGERTTDPAQAMEGPLFPVGGPKGYAMAVVVDALTGILTDSAFGLRCFGLEHQNVGHLMIAIDIAQFTPVVAFKARMDALIDEIHSAPLAAWASEIRLPGELEHSRAQARAREGVPIEQERLDELRVVARELGVDELQVSS